MPYRDTLKGKKFLGREAFRPKSKRQSWPSHWKMRWRCVAMLLEALFSDCERCDVKCFIKFPMNDICGERTKRLRVMFSEKDTQLSTAMG